MSVVILFAVLALCALAWQIVRELRALRATVVAAGQIYIRRDDEAKATLAER